jgi:hypothetical protein
MCGRREPEPAHRPRARRGLGDRGSGRLGAFAVDRFVGDNCDPGRERNHFACSTCGRRGRNRSRITSTKERPDFEVVRTGFKLVRA